MTVPIYAFLVAGTLLAAAGQVMLKLGASGRNSLAIFLNIWTATGLLCYAVSTVLWIYALAKAPLTVVYPFTALTFVFVYAAGVMLLGEATSAKSLVGVSFVLIGLYLVWTRA